MLSLVCIGCPRADLNAEVSRELLASFSLQPVGQVLAEDIHKPLPKELSRGSYAGNLKLDLSLGGVSAVAAIVAAALARHEGRGEARSQGKDKPNVTLIGGCASCSGGIGKDDMGRRLNEMCRQGGVQPFLSETDTEATGWRAVLQLKPEEKAPADPTTSLSQVVTTVELSQDERSQLRETSTVTFAGASHEYKFDHLKWNTRLWEQVTTSSILYMESMFLTVCPESTRYIAEHCAKVGKIFALNLSAQYICRFFRDRILAILPYLDFVFGNETEYMDLFASPSDASQERSQRIDEAVSWLAKVPRADGDANKRRFVVATCGLQPTIVASSWKGEGVKVRRYPVPPVRSYRFTGKDGAGDAFAGGFLYGLMRESDLDSCVQMALYAAQSAVQRTTSAFVFKDRPPIERSTKSYSD